MHHLSMEFSVNRRCRWHLCRCRGAQMPMLLLSMYKYWILARLFSIPLFILNAHINTGTGTHICCTHYKDMRDSMRCKAVVKHSTKYSCRRIYANLLSKCVNISVCFALHNGTSLADYFGYIEPYLDGMEWNENRDAPCDTDTILRLMIRHTVQYYCCYY